MFKKLILSLPFVKAMADDYKTLNREFGQEKLRLIEDKAIVAQALVQIGNENQSLEKKYNLALSDLSDKNVQIHELTRVIDAIVDYFIPEKDQPYPLEYKNCPHLIIEKCSQKKKSKKPKKSVKKAK